MLDQFQCQNSEKNELTTWLVTNHIRDIVNLHHEPPVQDFVKALHTNKTSANFLSQLVKICENNHIKVICNSYTECVD